MRLVIDLQGAQGGNSKRGIGRYSRELALAMARCPREHEVIVTLNGSMTEAAEELVTHFSSVLPRRQIRSWFSPTSGEQDGFAGRAAQIIRAQFLSSLRPDLVHVSSVFEGLSDLCITHSPSSLERLPLVGTCYDLIPLIKREEYLEGNGALAPHARWYYAGLQEMFLMDGLLAISESSRQEAIGYLGFNAAKVFNIQAGIQPHFRPTVLDESEHRALLRRYGLQGPFILFVGAGDIRKNETALVEAYTQLAAGLRDQYQLVVVGRVPEAPLRQIMERVGCPVDRLVIVPFVDESDLIRLYGTCAVFVFPSLHEGFGLPAAEAMACGAPVIASNTSSLPEVLGLADALFDPRQTSEITGRIEQVLSNPDLRQRLMAHGLAQASRFTWEACAERAWDGLEQIQERRTVPERGNASVLRQLPSLGFVSPLPPQASGIADYSRSLLPALARFYDITLVTEKGETSDPWLNAIFPQLDAEAFLKVGASFDRILYQLGCSDFHTFQYRQLLPVHPGVSVLHDTFLSNLWNWLAHHEGQPDEFLVHLYQSHGYSALDYEARHGRDEAVRQYPCCQAVLEQSLATIQHSQYAVALLTMHFGEQVRKQVTLIPLLAHLRPRLDRAAARRELGVDQEQILICTFGIVSPAKLPARLLEAWEAVRGQKGHLVYVGATAGELGDFPLRDGDTSNAVRVTGRVDQKTYDYWLAAADIAVQLRTDSRGETSAAITDCLCFGVPLIVNLHGSARDLPDDCALKLPDHFETIALRDAIERLRDDTALRGALAQAGVVLTRERLNPNRIAGEYQEAIEAAYVQRDPPSPLNLSRSLSRLKMLPLRDSELNAVSQSLASTFRASPSRARLLIDMSELARHDARSGIQRVVREVGRRLLVSDEGHRRAEAVCFHQGHLRHAYEVGTRVLGSRSLPLTAAPVDMGEHDTLLCIDVNPRMTEAEFHDLRRRKLSGLRLIVIVYDLLPMLRPECFPEGITQVSSWYSRMLSMADQAICISRAVADELSGWLTEVRDLRSTPLPIDYFHLAGDFRIDDGGSEETGSVLAAMACTARRPTFLMTGTLEPRKAYSQALAAFEQLWTEGVDVGLLIVGKQGWQTQDLVQRLRSHPQLGSKLHWLEGISDVDLRRLYGMSSCLLMASEGEGFGLPLVEAARAGLPILTRDLPVFREVVGEHAIYFKGTETKDLAQALLFWLEAQARGAIPSSTNIRTLNWDSSARQLMTKIDATLPYHVWAPPSQ
ncbi:glycosyltransferase [Teichococcus vastitatis]|uniref:glycosyltransferase n=1 Tax=Teichococcus vastitatis TaxID=2307076 RepID=UPI000E70CB3B|nr:glycosyltransferase [Pseudoroseomonas vastitatis]